MNIKKGGKYTHPQLGEVEVISNTSRKVDGVTKKLVIVKDAAGTDHELAAYQFAKDAKPLDDGSNSSVEKTPPAAPEANKKEQAKPADAAPPAAKKAEEKKPEEKTESKFNFWPIVIVVGIVLAILAYFWWQNRQQSAVDHMAV
jgi:outer membrane biosynthesis protein TonB